MSDEKGMSEETMSNVYPLQSENQRYDEASLWVARLDRGLSGEEAAALRRWLDRHPKHRACLLEMADLWDRMDSLSVLSELFDPPADQPQSEGRPWRTIWAVAASVLALVFAVNLLAPMMPWTESQAPSPVVAQSETTNTLYETGVGAHSTVKLPDGTRMLLNTNTQVSVTYTKAERLLVLKRGELHVEVAHDEQRPLRVQAGDKLVEAVGTAFNVYLKEDRSFDVIVTEGRVRVRPFLEAEQRVPEQTDASSEVRELTRGQKLSVHGSGPLAVETIDNSTISDRLSWRDGNLVFRGETLDEALDELGRYTPVAFKVIDPRINDVRIAGLYRAGDVEGLLLALRENFDIDHRRTEEGVIELLMKE